MNAPAVLAASASIALAAAAHAQLSPAHVELSQSSAARFFMDQSPDLVDASILTATQPDPDPFGPYDRTTRSRLSQIGRAADARSTLSMFHTSRMMSASGVAQAHAGSDTVYTGYCDAVAAADLREFTFRILRPSAYRFHGSVAADGLTAGVYQNHAGVVLADATSIWHEWYGQEAGEPTPFDATGVLPAGEYSIVAACGVQAFQPDPSPGRGEASWSLALEISALCRADVNNDGFVDFFDFNDFATCFDGYGCPEGEDGDFNGDGFVDFFDYYEFIDAFELGC